MEIESSDTVAALKAGTKRKAPASPFAEAPANEPLASSMSSSASASAPASAPASAIRPKNEYDAIKHCIVTNDGTPDSMVKLIGLKSLFARQLPKMPKEYIVRLVFDRRHKSLAILSQDPKHRGGDEEIIGGICYRAYPEMRFAEIAFCAVSASQQVKGYGTKLMNLLKRQMVREGLEYSITYADNQPTIDLVDKAPHGLFKILDSTLMYVESPQETHCAAGAIFFRWGVRLAHEFAPEGLDW